MAEALAERWTVGGDHHKVFGNELASAAAISPTHKCHRVSGTTTIDTINLPWPTFSGELILIASGAWNWSASGNIALAGTGALTAGQAVKFFYYPPTGKWHPIVDNA